MNNLKLALPILFSISLSSCWVRLGDLNMISNRNINTKTEYVELKRTVTAKSSKRTTYSQSTNGWTGEKNYSENNVSPLEQAVDNCVRKIPGGEYLMNATIEKKGKKYRVTADVWGVAGVLSEKEKLEKQKLEYQIQLANKFKVGDSVGWLLLTKYQTGTIIGKNDTKAVVSFKNKKGVEETILVEYESLTLIHPESK
jgi:hypothetical protein